MTFSGNSNSKEVFNDDISKADDVLTDLHYIMEFTKLVSTFLKRGCDITQLPNGDSIISQMKVVHTNYKWNKQKNRFVRVIQQNNKMDNRC